MLDPIRQTHLLFEKYFGENMREWPEGAEKLKQELNSHFSKTIFEKQEKAVRETRVRTLGDVSDAVLAVYEEDQKEKT